MAAPAVLDDLAAIALLVGIGVPEPLADAMVAHWSAEKAARLVDVYGVHTTHPKAALLREKVAATREAVIKKLMPLAAARLALKSYEIPDQVADGLLALWAAQSLKQVLPP